MQRARKRGDDDGLIDDGPTVFDPEVPTGHDPDASGGMRMDDQRTTAPRAAAPEMLEDEPQTGATVVGKRNPHAPAPGSGPRNAPGSGPRQAPGSGPRQAPGSGPRVAPVPPLPPEELPQQRGKEPVRFDPSKRIDDLTRTAQWKGSDPLATPPVQVPMPPILPLQPGPQSAPIQVVSMKTPQDIEAEKAKRVLPAVQLRAIADVRQATPPQGMGFLAPPHDPKAARSRRWVDYVLWGSVAVMVAAVVTLAVWFIAR
jgi:hypothetical protein